MNEHHRQENYRPIYEKFKKLKCWAVGSAASMYNIAFKF